MPLRSFPYRPGALAGLALTAVFASTPALAAPVRPTDDALVLAIVAPTTANAVEIRRLRRSLAEEPTDLGRALDLARLAIQEGRATTDPRHYGEAEAALAPWWNDEKPIPAVRLVRAVIRQAQHDFAAAEADLDALISGAPANGQARLTRAFLRQATGRIAEAEEDCRKLPVQVGLIAAAVCRARTDALAGRARTGLDLLDRVVAREVAATPEMRRWAAATGAEIAEMLGDRAEAERRWREADGPEVSTLAGHADHLVETGRAADALTLLDGRGEADALVLRRTIAAKAAGRPEAARLAAMLDARFTVARRAGIRLHEREEARYRLDIAGDAAGALDLARANWAAQKEPADARLLLEAALAAGRPEAAESVLAHIAATGLADARLAPLVARLKETRS